MAVLCIDVGTTMVKAVMFDHEGREIKVARQSTVVHRRGPGYSEQDMYSVWDAVVYTVRSVVHQVKDPVRALAITGQGDGCWLVGEDGRPTGPAILWNDARASEIVDAWDRDGILERAYRINGTLGFPGTSGAIMSWLRANDPGRLDASHKALYCTGWIYNRLTGRFSADESDAASPFLDLVRGEYSAELMEMYGMPWVERLLPEIRRDGNRMSELDFTVAPELRLRPGIPVILAPFDIPATAIGIGTVSPNQACTILGTTLCTDIILDHPETGGTPAGMTLPSGVPGTYVKSLAAMAGVEIVAWGMKLMGLDNPNWLSDLAATTSPGSGGLLFHPYLSPAGERAPFRDSRARGSLIGLSFEHSRAEIARALLEGMSYVIRNCLEFGTDQADDLRLCGGGANSAVWCQILADVTGIPTTRSVDAEIGAKGAFLTTLVALGEEDDMASAVSRYVHARDTFDPDPTAERLYDELYQGFLDTGATMAAEWPRLARLRTLTTPVASGDADDGGMEFDDDDA
jgi:erythritol kinase